MKDRSRAEALISNERIKALSGFIFNLAIALTITIVVRVYGGGGFDWTALGWTIVDAMLIFIAYKTLSLLEVEDDAD